MPAKTIKIQYFAVLRELRGCSEESVQTVASTAVELYRELQAEHGFQLDPDALRLAVNDELRDWDTPLNDNDSVVFIPPIAGG
jgi:molybdopterin converting factor subunit 1